MMSRTPTTVAAELLAADKAYRAAKKALEDLKKELDKTLSPGDTVQADGSLWQWVHEVAPTYSYKGSFDVAKTYLSPSDLAIVEEHLESNKGTRTTKKLKPVDVA